MKRIFSLYIVLTALAVSLLPALLSAQQLVLKTYDRSSGLPSDYVMNMFQDRDGFIWFSTDRGLCRYNGKTFTTYTKKEGLPDNFVQYCNQDSAGNLWLGIYEHGIVRYDGTTFQSYTMRDGLIGNTLKWMAQDRFGRLYFCSNDGISIFYKGKFYSYKGLSALTTSVTMSDGTLYFSDDKLLYRIHPSNDTAFHYKQIQLKNSDGITHIGVFEKPSLAWNGATMYIGYFYSVTLNKFINDSTLVTVREYPLNGFTSHIIHEGDTTLWCSSLSNGITKITPNSTTRYGTKQGLLQLRCETLMRDYEGNIWVSSFGSGVQKLSTTAVSLSTESNGLPDNQVTALYEDKSNNVWLGTSSGLAVLRGDSILQFAKKERKLREVRTITSDKNENFYIGTFEYLFGPATVSKLQTADTLQSIRVGFGVSGIFPINDSVFQHKQEPSVLVGSYGEGIKRYFGKDSLMFLTDKAICSNVIEKVVPANNAAWFLSENGGATRWEQGVFQLYSMNNGLPSNSVYSLYEDSARQRIWFGTDIGLTRYERNAIRTYTKADGLFGAPVIGIFPDSASDAGSDTPLWIISRTALHYFKNGTLTLAGIFSFGQTGILSINTALVTSRRSLLLGTPHGLYTVQLSAFQRTATYPKIVITSIVHDTTALYTHRVSEQRAIVPELQYTQNNITIEYSGLSFINEQATTFRFKLHPLDETWSQPTGDNHVQFRNLDNGEYTFYVEAINGDGIHSLQPATISFRILPPFWKRWWFITIASLAAFGITAGTIRYVSQRKLLKQVQELERQQELQRERDRISRDLHDNVGAQMVSIISGLELAGRYSDTQARQVKPVLDSLQEDARTTMALLRETIWALQASDMKPEKFSAELEQYIRKQLRYRPEIQLHFNSKIQSATLLRPVEAINILRIAQEALTNSLKHASPTFIRVELQATQNNALKVVIENDGSLGSNSADISGGKGLPNMERRASELGGTFSFVQMETGIVQVAISIPIKPHSS